MKTTDYTAGHGRGSGARAFARRNRRIASSWKVAAVSVYSVWSVVSFGAESVRTWQVCGPFESRSVLVPVVENEGVVTPAAEVAGKSWKEVVSDQDVVDLESAQAFGHQNHCVAFAYTEIDVEAGGDLLLGIGSDDAVAVWWNGKPVLIHDVLRGTKPGEDKVHVRAKPGKNSLLLKVYDEGGGWGFAVEWAPVAP